MSEPWNAMGAVSRANARTAGAGQPSRGHGPRGHLWVPRRGRAWAASGDGQATKAMRGAARCLTDQMAAQAPGWHTTVSTDIRSLIEQGERGSHW